METIRLATFNLWWRFGDADARQPAIETVLRRAQPDVVALQEVWFTGQMSLAGQLSAALEFHTAWAPAADSSRWQARGHPDHGIGNAILSRWPVETMDIVTLPPGDRPDESRFAVSAMIATPFGRQRITNVHLNSGWHHNEIRRRQLAHLVSWIADQDLGDLPAALLGDFNAGPDFDEIRPLTGRSAPYDDRLPLIDSWEYVNGDDPGYTWDRANPQRPSGEPSFRVDYVFVGAERTDGTGRIRSSERLGVQPIEGIVASDHYGVITEIQATAATGEERPSPHRDDIGLDPSPGGRPVG